MGIICEGSFYVKGRTDFAMMMRGIQICAIHGEEIYRIIKSNRGNIFTGRVGGNIILNAAVAHLRSQRNSREILKAMAVMEVDTLRWT